MLYRIFISCLFVAAGRLSYVSSLAPKFFTPMQNITATIGEDAQFVCQIENISENKVKSILLKSSILQNVSFLKLDHPPLIIFFQQKVYAKPEKYAIDGRDGMVNGVQLWTLKLWRVDEIDAGGYMCQVGIDTRLSQTAFLTLRTPPKILAEKTYFDVVAMENTNVTLTCEADSEPKPNITWKRVDEQNIITNNPEGHGANIVYGQNLTLYNISPKHMADYICLADNGIIPNDAWSIRLHVHFAPKAFSGETHIIGYPGRDIVLQCKMQGWPQPKFYWLFHNQLLMVNSSKYQMVLNTQRPVVYEIESTLIITSLKDEDFGVYVCSAENVYGLSQVALEIQSDLNFE